MRGHVGVLSRMDVVVEAHGVAEHTATKSRCPGDTRHMWRGAMHCILAMIAPTEERALTDASNGKLTKHLVSIVHQ